MDEDIAEMLAASAGGSTRECSVCRLLNEMTPEHRATFELALDTPGINTTGILAWMAKRGYKLNLIAPAKRILEHKAQHRG
jgi:hypothetical protein